MNNISKTQYPSKHEPAFKDMNSREENYIAAYGLSPTPTLLVSDKGLVKSINKSAENIFRVKKESNAIALDEILGQQVIHTDEDLNLDWKTLRNLGRPVELYLVSDTSFQPLTCKLVIKEIPDTGCYAVFMENLTTGKGLNGKPPTARGHI